MIRPKMTRRHCDSRSRRAAAMGIAVFAFIHALADAATVTWGTPFNIGNSAANVLNAFDATKNGGAAAGTSPTIIEAVNYGFSGITVNGVAFSSLGGNTDYWGSGSSAGTPSGLNSAIDQLLSGHSAMSGTSTPFTISLSGLKIGSRYQIQIISGHDNRTSSNIYQRAYEVSFGASDFTSGGTPPTLTRGAQLISGACGTVVGFFTADATSQTITLRSKGGLSANTDPAVSAYILIGDPPPAPAVVWGAPFLINNDPSNILNHFDSTKNGGGTASDNPAVFCAVNYGYGGVTVNGVSFSSMNGSTDYWGAGSAAGTPAGLDSSIDQLLSGHVAQTGTTTLFPITFTGLTVGKKYQLQVICGHDNRTSSNIYQRAYEVSFGDSDFTGGGTPPTLTRGAQLVSGAFDTVVGSFTATADSQTVNLRSKGGLTANTDPAVSAYVLIGDPPPPKPPVDYATMQYLESDDTAARIVEKAAKTLPRANQVTWQRLEMTFFAHFGVNTFNAVEWGTGYEDPSVFNPTAFDADQWIREIKDAGGKMLILVVKHHDGFCLWPSRYTAHDVASSTWMGGTGNVVRAVSDACHARGIKLGLYLSPADLFQIHSSAPEGFYANGSASVLSTIPTDPASFTTAPATGRTPPAGFIGYTYSADDYNRYFLNELYELLTEYGTIDEMWFDGANPEPGYVETYNYADWYDMIHKLQPNAVIAIGGPDVRWVGNENGTARTDEWSVIPYSAVPGSGGGAPDGTAADLGSRAKLTAGSYLWWFPAECDVPILNGWFWSSSKTAKSASTLLGIYYTSVGRNATMLLNLSPDTRGLIPDSQLAALRSLGQIVRNTFAINLAAGATITAPTDSLLPAANLQDGNPDTFWEAAASNGTADLVFDLPVARTIDLVSLQEPIASRGQRIEGFAIDTWDGSAWTTQATGTTVGYKRLMKFTSAVTTNRVRIRITNCRLNPSLAEVTFNKEAVTIAAPTISDRDASAGVTLSGTTGYTIRYTLDGTTPTSASAAYLSPIAVPLGATVCAASFGGDGLPGIIATKDFANLAPLAWSVVADSQANATTNAAVKAIDDNPSTSWQSGSAALPHWIVVDMQTTRCIGGFTYLPPAGGGTGTVKGYRFETSMDNAVWTKVAEGTFGNIVYSPVLQTVSFAAVTARYFRFTALQEILGNTWVSAAEVGVVPAGFDAWCRQRALQTISPSADPDGNGASSLMEYAAVIEPGTRLSTPVITAYRAAAGDLRIRLRHRDGMVDVDEILQRSDNLTDWQTSSMGTVFANTPNSDGSYTIERSLPVTPDTGPTFYRILFRLK